MLTFNLLFNITPNENVISLALPMLPAADIVATEAAILSVGYFLPGFAMTNLWISIEYPWAHCFEEPTRLRFSAGR